MSTNPQQHQIYINGDEVSMAVGTTIADALLQHLDIDPQHTRGVAVAVNDEVVRREAWQDVALQADDRIEVITARQGG